MNYKIFHPSKDINCEISIVQTNTSNTMEQSSSSENPSDLKSLVNLHLAGSMDYDFAIIGVGNEDITNLDTNKPINSLSNTVSEQTKSIVEVAETISIENNLDVFIVDQPPRYDTCATEPNNIFYKLSKYQWGSGLSGWFNTKDFYCRPVKPCKKKSQGKIGHF